MKKMVTSKWKIQVPLSNIMVKKEDLLIELTLENSKPSVIQRDIVTTPVVLDPAVFNPNKGILTRYSKKLLQEGDKFYGLISLKE